MRHGSVPSKKSFSDLPFWQGRFLCGRKDMEMQKTRRLCRIASLIGCNSCNINVIYVTILPVKRRDSIIGFK